MQSSSNRPSIAVVGSVNMDLVVPCRRLPQPGETIVGETLLEVPGGKGANQAVAVARLGAEVSMVGRVGGDDFATRLVANLREETVNVSFLGRSPHVPSGIAIVCVEASGENAITIIPGANAHVTPADVQAAASVIAEADVLMLQLEIPVETVLAAVEIAKDSGTKVLLDPAPAPQETPVGLLHVDLLCPNETEAAALTGLVLDSDANVKAAAARLCKMGAGSVVITLGARGAFVFEEDGVQDFIPSALVDPVDTTAAGDAFAAALAVRTAQCASLRDAVQFACVAGALATSRPGAQIAMPTRASIEDELRRLGIAAS